MSSMVLNSLGRAVPTEIPGLGKFDPFTGPFARMLISFRTVTSKDFGAAEVYVDGKKVSTLRAVKDGAWGQSDTALVYTSKEAMEHTVEIRMAEGSEDKCFTVTCIGIAR